MDEPLTKTSSRKKVSSAVCGGCCCSSCGCQGSNWQCYHSSLLARWILGLVIIVLVFWCGMKIGELKAELRGAGFGWEQRGWSSSMNRPQRMMIFDPAIETISSSASTADTTTDSKKR